MKTTLIIDDGVFTRIKTEAARRGTTISEIVEAALRAYLKGTKETAALRPLPVYNLGVPLVDIADREALGKVMDEDEEE